MNASDSNSGAAAADQPTLFGHPTGLFTLFFAEMWERFSYYGMRALLVLYMVKGFMKYTDGDAYAVYGAYTALVYMTPFFGGMIADRLIGARRAVILGGLLMAAGHLVMAFENEPLFYTALALLIAGNGFFKPNISTIVGSLYPQNDPRRDGGFTIFYIGINLGAALAPLLCGYIGETFGWHYGFNLATIGMLIGLAVFWAPTRVAQMLILLGAGACAFGMIWVQLDAHPVILVSYTIMGLILMASAVVSFMALGRGGLPDDAGQAPDEERMSKPLMAGLKPYAAVMVGTLISIPIIAVLVGARSFSIISEDWIEGLAEGGGLAEVAGVVLERISTPAGLILTLAGAFGLVFLVRETFTLGKIARERMFVVLILTFFSLLFWSFFEQAGSSVNLFTDRNVDRVLEESKIEQDDIGKDMTFRIVLNEADAGDLAEHPPLTSEQFGRTNGDPTMRRRAAEIYREMSLEREDLSAEDKKNIENAYQTLLAEERLTMTMLTVLREHANEDDTPKQDKLVSWKVAEDNVGMGVGGTEMSASIFQAINPFYIMLFGVPFTLLWALLAKMKLEPNTPVKFALGLAQLGCGFGAFYMGATSPDSFGITGISWLLLGYLLQTTGELCLSPVGLSMVTKLSPKRLVSTVMGSWFLATAFSNFLAAVIAQFTGVEEGGDGGGVIPVPSETVDLYGSVFGKIAITALACGGICLLLSPILKKWMHEGEHAPEEV